MVGAKYLLTLIVDIIKSIQMKSNELDILASPRRASAPPSRNNLFAGIKLSLLAAVLMLLGVLAIHLLPTNESVEEIEPVATNPHTEPTHTTDLMENPTLTRTDSKGRLFTVSATSASRDRANSEEVTLKDVKADAAFDSPFRENDQMFLRAASAILRTDAEQLDLFAPINIQTTSNYQFQAEWVGINLEQNRIEKAGSVFINGPEGSIKAGTMNTSTNGQSFTFQDNVRVKWNLATSISPSATPGLQ